MFLSKLKTKLALVATIGVLAGGAHAQSLELDLSVAPTADDLKALASGQDGLDEDTFFSGGSASSNAREATGSITRSTAAAVKKRPPSVDVDAVCRAVLADGPANYSVRFYQGCRAAVDRRAFRQAYR